MPEDETPRFLENVFAVLPAGGSGTRLWPVSRQLYPKQLVKFIGNDSLVQSTIKRMTPLIRPENITIICGEAHVHEIARHAREAGVEPEGRVIAEPCGRNTAPAILLGLFHIAQIRQEAVVCVFPADHVIRDDEEFRNKVRIAVELASKGHIVTFGIAPKYPETGYGYIEAGRKISDEAFHVKRFVEKPDGKTAAQYIRTGRYYWNAGMFTFKLSVMMEEFHRLAPDLYRALEDMRLNGRLSPPADYEKLPDISIDYAIMEKTDKAAVLPADFGWSDIGSWKSLFDFLPKDGQNNVVDGDVIARDAKNCFILGRERLIAVNHVENIVVVDTPDSVFVSDIRSSRDVKSIVAMLKERGRKEFYRHRTVNHSWGTVSELEEADAFAVCRITVFAGQDAVLFHAMPRVSHLTLISGDCRVCVGNDCRILTPGQSFRVEDPSRTLIRNAGAGPVDLIGLRLAPDSLQPAGCHSLS